MKSIRKALITGLLLAGLIPFAGSAWAYSSGRFTTPESGGPFPGEQVCTRCHAGSDANSGDGTVDLLIGGASASDFSYTPGETVSLILNFTDANAARSGFQLTVRSGDGCGQPGSLAAGSGDNGATVQVREGTCGTGSIQWATHRRPTTGTSATWDVAWTAPAESAGTVTIAFAVNGANGNGARTGDSIYTYTATIEPAAATAPAPVISDSGVVLADLFSETTTGAPNALAAVLGSGFSEAAAPISGTVDDSGRVSTILDETCVEVNQHRAPLVQVGSDEITFQIPADTGLGAASVKVIRGCDTDDETSSNSAQFQVAAVKPVFFLFSDSPPGIAALHVDLSLVAAADAVTGRVTRPALPGEVVTFFGTGFGPTEPPLDTGEIAVQPQSLETSDLRPMIGELEVTADDILYAGAAPNFAGLYQLSLKIPDATSAGSHAFSVMLDGVTSAAGPMLEIGEPAAAEAMMCAVATVLQVGESCEVAVGEATVEFNVNESGQGCIVADMETTCGDTTVSAGGGEAAKNDDGSWTISKLPDPPAPMESEPQECTAGLVVNPGESCAATISGITGVLEVAEDGGACVTVSTLAAPLCGDTMVSILATFGAEVEMNDDLSWTVKTLPPAPAP